MYLNTKSIYHWFRIVNRSLTRKLYTTCLIYKKIHFISNCLNFITHFKTFIFRSNNNRRRYLPWYLNFACLMHENVCNSIQSHLSLHSEQIAINNCSSMQYLIAASYLDMASLPAGWLLPFCLRPISFFYIFRHFCCLLFNTLKTSSNSILDSIHGTHTKSMGTVYL